MSDADADEQVTVFPTRHVHLRGVRTGDPRIGQFWTLVSDLDRRARTPLAQYRRDLARLAKTLGLQAPTVSETPAPDVRVRTPMPLAALTPESAVRPGVLMKVTRATEKAIKAGIPFPWRETSTTTGESRIVYAPIPRPPAAQRVAAKKQIGRPPHPLRAEIRAAIAKHPRRNDSEHVQAFNDRNQSVSRATVRRVRLAAEAANKAETTRTHRPK